MQRILCLTASLFVPGLVCAQDTASLSYFYQLDEDDGTSHSLAADYQLSPELWLSIGIDRTQLGEANGEIETEGYHAGLSYSVTPEWDVAYYYQHWGDNNFIKIGTHRFELTTYRDNWAFSLSPEYQAIDITFNEVDWARIWRRLGVSLLNAFQIQQRINALIDEIKSYDEFNAYGLSLNATYYGMESAYISAGFGKYDYSEDVSVFERVTPVAHLMLSPSTFMAIDGFVDWHAQLEYGRFYEQSSYAILLAYQESAINQAGYSSVVGNAAFEITKGLALMLELGASDSETDSAFMYGGLGLSVSF